MSANRRSRPVVSEGQLKKKVIDVYGAPADSTVVVTASELMQWKNIMEQNDRDKLRTTTSADEKARLMSIANERKAKIIAHDEERRAKGSTKSPEDAEEEVTKHESLSKAQLQMDEELDEVKYMNKVTLLPTPFWTHSFVFLFPTSLYCPPTDAR